MSRLRRVAAFALGSALLPACVTPPAKPQMTRQMLAPRACMSSASISRHAAILISPWMPMLRL